MAVHYQIDSFDRNEKYNKNEVVNWRKLKLLDVYYDKNENKDVQRIKLTWFHLFH